MYYLLLKYELALKNLSNFFKVPFYSKHLNAFLLKKLFSQYLIKISIFIKNNYIFKYILKIFIYFIINYNTYIISNRII